MRGGRRLGSGRKPGAITRRTRQIADNEVDKAAMPLDYLLNLMRDETASVQRRDWAADRAAQYCHPRLSAIAVRDTSAPRTVNNVQVTFVVPDGHELGDTIDNDVIRIGPPQ